jgi:hypothetical protein
MSRLDEIRKLLENEPDDPFLLYASALEIEHIEGREKALLVLLNLRSIAPLYLPLYYKAAELALELGKYSLTDELIKDGIVLAKKLNNSKTTSELVGLNNRLKDEMEL